jgi:TPR repeat protein
MDTAVLIRKLERDYEVSQNFQAASALFFSENRKADESELIAAFEEAAKTGDAAAKMVLSRLLALAPKDLIREDLAFKNALEAAEANIKEAQYDVGICYFLGVNGLSALKTRMSDNWEKYPVLLTSLPPKDVSNMRSSNAPPIITPYDPQETPLRPIGSFRIPGFGQEHLALIRGSKSNHDRGQAISWLRRAAKLGFSPALALLGNILTLYGEIPAEGLNYLVLAAKAGDPEALVSLGDYCTKGIGTPLDMSQGLDYYRKAADMEDEEGIISQIRTEFALIGCPRDVDQALSRLMPLAIKGFAPAKKLIAIITGVSG